GFEPGEYTCHCRDIAIGSVGIRECQQNEDGRDDKECPGDYAAKRAMQQPADVDGYLLSFGARQQPTIIEGVEKSFFAQQPPPLDQFPVHYGYLTCRASKGNEAELHPEAKGFSE